MKHPDLLDSIDQLEHLYDAPGRASRKKVSNNLTPSMQRWLASSPFFVLATYSDDGLDCSPRGDPSGEAFRVLDEKTIAIPDRRGNNRINTLRNLITDSRVGLLFIVPGIQEALRIKGRADISVNKALLDSFASDEEPAPATVMLVHVHSAYIQNARAINRAQLWDPQSYNTADQMPDAEELSRISLRDAKT